MKQSEKDIERDYLIAFCMIRYLFHTGKISKKIFEQAKKELSEKIVQIDINTMI